MMRSVFHLFILVELYEPNVEKVVFVIDTNHTGTKSSDLRDSQALPFDYLFHTGHISKLLHTYIIGYSIPSVRIMDLFSHTTYVVREFSDFSA